MTLTETLLSKWDEFVGIQGRYHDAVVRHNWFIKNCDLDFLREIIEQENLPEGWLGEFDSYDPIACVDTRKDTDRSMAIGREFEVSGIRNVCSVTKDILPRGRFGNSLNEMKRIYTMYRKWGILKKDINELVEIINDGFDIISNRVEFIYKEQLRVEELMRELEAAEQQAAPAAEPEAVPQAAPAVESATEPEIASEAEEESATILNDWSEKEEFEKMIPVKWEKFKELAEAYNEGVRSLKGAVKKYGGKLPERFTKYCIENKYLNLSKRNLRECALGSSGDIRKNLSEGLDGKKQGSLVNVLIDNFKLFYESSLTNDIMHFGDFDGRTIELGKMTELLEYRIDCLFGKIEGCIEILQSEVDEINSYSHQEKEAQSERERELQSALESESKSAQKTNPIIYERFENVINEDYDRLKKLAKELGDDKLNGSFNNAKSAGEKFSIIYRRTFTPDGEGQITSANIWQVMPRNLLVRNGRDQTEGRAVVREIGSKIYKLFGDRALDLCEGKVNINKEEMDELESLIDKGLNVVETAIDRCVKREERKKSGVEKPAKQELSSPGLREVKECYEKAASFICGNEGSDFSELSEKFDSVRRYPFWQGFKKLSSKSNLVSTKEKAVALLFVSMGVVGSISTAIKHFCDAIKKGGINKKSKDEVILEADMVRYLVKNYAQAHPDNSTPSGKFVDYLKTVLVGKFKLVTNTEFDAMWGLFARQ